MCDTRTWVFKLLIVFLIIHCSRIQQCRVAAAPAATAVVVDGTDIDVAAAAISNDDDSFEISSTPEDTISESQRSTFNRTYNNRQSNSKKDDAQQLSSLSSSSSGSIANRLASDDGVTDGDLRANADDDDGSDEEEEFKRKFNNAAEAERATKSTKTALVFGILKRAENEKDYVGDPASMAVNPTPSGSTASTAPWNGSADDDEEDVDEILQPMMVLPDKRHYNSNNGRHTMSSGMGYSMEYHPTGNNDGDEESNGSNSFKEPSVTNRMKSVYQSAFEQHKALIRNNKRYGHKSHKKKYKDYLHYNPPTTQTTSTTTSISPLQKNILARDRIYNSDDLPRPYYQGHVNYYMNTNDYDGFHDAEKKAQNPSSNSRSYHSPSYPRHHQQHHNSGHLRSGGRYRHNSLQSKNQRPHTSNYPDYNMMNYHHLGSRAKQQHQKELEKKIDEYSQYYSKWPHLAQVEDQLFEDEHTDMLYPEGDGSAGELLLTAEDDDDGDSEKEEEDPNLPPYIKKYRRRNKQLLDLLEGTQPPTTPSSQWSSSVLKPGPIEGSHQNLSPRHHLRQHRLHHHHRQHRNKLRSHRHKNSKWQIEDLFEEQRANPNNPNRTTTYSEILLPKKSTLPSSSSTTSTTTTSTTTLSPFDELLKHENEHIKLLQENQIPADDVSISRELYDWAIEVGKDQSHMEDDDYVDDNHSELYSWKTNRNARPSNPLTTTTIRPVASVRRPNVYGSIMKAPPLVTTSTMKPINSFVYHRVVEAPRVVGAGQTGRKQRLPFVAITDRRLETSRKGMSGNGGVLARKDFEQNHFPMP